MSETDARLVERARGGDAAAFDALVRRHLRAAHATAISVVRDTADAEDVCQDAFVSALERLEECRHPERFRAWLVRIVRNRALNHVRYEGLRDSAPLSAALDRADGRSPAEHTELSLLRERLEAALGTLSPVQRQVVLLHDLEGWRHREIAESLDMAEGTVRSHLFHARRGLRAVLGAQTEEN